MARILNFSADITKIAKSSYTCLLLNGTRQHLHKFERNLWNNAKTRVSIDGGFNLYKQTIALGHTLKEPSIYFLGDGDSVQNETFDKLPVTEHGSSGQRVSREIDQDATDFTKSIRFLQTQGQDLDKIYVLMTNGMDRFDHIIGSLSTLYRYT